MKIQKIYIGYSILMWILWGTIMLLLNVSGNAYNVQNEQLFFILSKISIILNLISIIPIIPGLWIFAFKHSIINKNRRYVVFNVISVLFSIGLWFQYFITHVVLIIGA